jgi:dTDP-4-dehydrorhamnose reductase
MGKGGNFVNTMLRLAREGKPVRVIHDQVCTPTFTQDLAAQIAVLIETNQYGTYHTTNDGGCSWYEFALEIFRLAGLTPEVTPITSDEFNAPARRPAYSVLENRALRQLGIDHMRDWHEALAEYIRLVC